MAFRPMGGFLVIALLSFGQNQMSLHNRRGSMRLWLYPTSWILSSGLSWSPSWQILLTHQLLDLGIPFLWIITDYSLSQPIPMGGFCHCFIILMHKFIPMEEFHYFMLPSTGFDLFCGHWDSHSRIFPKIPRLWKRGGGDQARSIPWSRGGGEYFLPLSFLDPTRWSIFM